jgi:signal transduction histidine kinase
MNDMIEKILDIRAIDARNIKIEKELFNIGEETQLIIDQFTDHASKKSIRIHRDLNPASVQLDRNYFRQILENLISNAIKFSPKNKNIYITTFQRNGKAMLTVRDEGPGFSPEDKKKLFGKFQKLSARPTGGESSTGIGLSIVKKYVDAMHGNIYCDSELGKGAIFTVEFNTNRL